MKRIPAINPASPPTFSRCGNFGSGVRLRMRIGFARQSDSHSCRAGAPAASPSPDTSGTACDRSRPAPSPAALRSSSGSSPRRPVLPIQNALPRWPPGTIELRSLPETAKRTRTTARCAHQLVADRGRRELRRGHAGARLRRLADGGVARVVDATVDFPARVRSYQLLPTMPCSPTSAPVTRTA